MGVCLRVVCVFCWSAGTGQLHEDGEDGADLSDRKLFQLLMGVSRWGPRPFLGARICQYSFLNTDSESAGRGGASSKVCISRSSGEAWLVTDPVMSSEDLTSLCHIWSCPDWRGEGGEDTSACRGAFWALTGLSHVGHLCIFPFSDGKSIFRVHS